MSKRDPAYLSFIRSLPCCAPGAKRGGRAYGHATTCIGPIEAHHRTGAGLALKAADKDTMPLCLRHHRALHDNTGVFHGWDKSRRKEWQRTMVKHHQALHRKKRVLTPAERAEAALADLRWDDDATEEIVTERLTRAISAAEAAVMEEREAIGRDDRVGGRQDRDAVRRFAAHDHPGQSHPRPHPKGRDVTDDYDGAHCVHWWDEAGPCCRCGYDDQDETDCPGRKPTMNIESKLEACARAAHEANRSYCLALGDTSQPSWDNAPEWQRTSAINGVRGVLDGNTPEQSHEDWLAEKAATGWKYGPVKDPEKKEHPCFVPYAELPHEQRQKDHVFVGVVCAVASALGLAPALLQQARLAVELLAVAEELLAIGGKVPIVRVLPRGKGFACKGCGATGSVTCSADCWVLRLMRLLDKCEAVRRVQGGEGA